MEDTSLYNVGSQCTFRNLGVRCSEGLPFGFMCARHGEMFLGRLVEDRLTNLNGTREKRLYVKLTRSNNERGVLMFPFNLENETVVSVPSVGQVLTGNFCLDPVLANQQIQQFVAQLDLRREDEKLFASILNSILGLGVGFFTNSCQNLSYFVDYAKQLHKIKPRLQRCYMQYDVSEATNQVRYVSLDSLPPFYQGLLYNVELSTIKTETGQLELTPIIALDSPNHKFVVNTDTLVYVCRDDATDATPLVLAGIRISNLRDPFNIPDQENARYVGFNDVQVVCPRANGERIQYSYA